MDIQITNFKLDSKYLPFLIDKEGQTIVESAGYVNGALSLSFKDGLKGSFQFEPESEEVKKAIENKGYFVVDAETGESGQFFYEETKVSSEKSKTSRAGSNQKRISW